MNYLEIVLQGYFNENNREYLEKYFYREFRKAEMEFYEADEFFSGCLKVVTAFEEDLKRQLHKRKKELYFMLNGAKNGTLQYVNPGDKPIEQRFKDTIEDCTQELAGISINDFTVHLPSFTNGRVGYNLSNYEVLLIKHAIEKAFQMVESSKTELTIPNQQITTRTDKLKAELEKYGFYSLPTVITLSEQSKQNLTELISTNGLPYSIAMFDFLGFFKYLKKEYFRTSYKLNQKIAIWFDTDERAVKGNISTLHENSTENKERYTAHKHKETVAKDYKNLK
jgi:hypothetical protein